MTNSIYIRIYALLARIIQLGNKAIKKKNTIF